MDDLPDHGCGCGALHAGIHGIERQCHTEMDPDIPGDGPVQVRFLRRTWPDRGTWGEVIVREDCATAFVRSDPEAIHIVGGADAADE